jgi:O-succinylbenzoic acid--CoA ligase
MNQHYGLTQKMSWGCVLPTYHVGGLSILARAYLSQAKVFSIDWKNFSIDWLSENEIALLSLVPTQLYDIIQKNMKSPASIKYVFIGGAHLSREIYQQAIALGWPLVVTFGMTETSSMFASRTADSDLYTPYQDVEIAITAESQLKVKCDSLADYVLQKVDTEIAVKPVQVDDWYVTEDFVELNHGQFKFINRSFDQIKINGEGVSLFQLREKLENCILKMHLDVKAFALISLQDERSGEQIVLVSTKTGQKNTASLCEQFNQSVLPFEKIKKIVNLQSEIPMTEMSKIKYLELKNLVLKEQNESDRT